MINVTRSSMPPIQEYIDEITPLWDSHWLTNAGSIHNRLEEELKTYLDADNLLLTVNGHMALELTLQALEITGEVITTPFTFVSTTNALIRNGIKPVFCDINPIDYTMDVTKIESLITEKTTAIMPVHVYGNICNIEEIDRIAKKHDLKVIYDAAHTFGVKYKGKGLAAYGDAVCYSFHATKVFNTIEGGAICFKDYSYTDRIKSLRDFGIVDEEVTIAAGANCKMNEFAAAMGICNLRHIDEELAKRHIVEDTYRKLLSGTLGLTCKPVQEDVQTNSSYFPVIIDPTVCGKTRDDVHAILSNNGIGSRKYFYPLTNEFGYTRNICNNPTPIAKDISNKILTLPLYADLSIEDVERICELITNILWEEKSEKIDMDYICGS